MDEETKLFFLKHQKEDSENQFCIDDGTTDPQWASVSHGCYISMESAGVHRSLGVDISFVRSTTMDAWKPQQLKSMELGGNRKLKEFFRKHKIADDMPIDQKYRTRAADWYRRNLRALVGGTEQPAPLPEGTGHLLLSDPSSTAQNALSKAAVTGGMVAGSAIGSAAPSFGGYHSGGYHSGVMGEGHRQMEGFGSSQQQPSFKDHTEDFLSGVLGQEVGTKVTGSVWSALGAARTLAGRAKSVVEAKVDQAQKERWLDNALNTARQGVDAAVETGTWAAQKGKEGVGAAVETTTWAAQKGVEAGKATVSYVNEGGGKAVIGKTTEVLQNTAQTSMSLVGTSVDWVSERVAELNAAPVFQGSSTESTLGFGVGYGPRSNGVTSAGASSSSSSGSRSYHSEQPVFGQSASSSSSTGVAAAPAMTGPAKQSASKDALWNDKSWEDWN